MSGISDQKVWFITGASKGMGLALVQVLLSKGNKVAATSRNAEDLKSKVKGYEKNFLPLQVDLTSDESVEDGN